MILSGLQIKEEIEKGNSIVIEPFEVSRLNPNSYNVTLNDKLLVYKEKCLDMKKLNEVTEIIIPEEGYVLEPGELYLAQINEYTETRNGLVPMIDGRSSVGRLGIFVHITAGFGDVGYKGRWTLEISVIKPVRIYAGCEIAQLSYHKLAGDYKEYCSSKYQNSVGVQASKMYEDFIGVK